LNGFSRSGDRFQFKNAFPTNERKQIGLASQLAQCVFIHT
jgi:hypothetical protein